MSTIRVDPLSAGLGFALPVGLIVLFLLAPVGDSNRVAGILAGICAQRPSHSLGYPGQPMALEARMYGIFAGFAVTMAYAWLVGGWRRTRLPRGLQLALVLAFIAVMGLDGLRSLYFDLGIGGGIWTPRNDVRVITGLLCGFATAVLITPVVNQALFKETEDVPLFRTWGEMGRGVLLLGALAVVSLLPFMPIVVLSIFAAVSVVAAFWVVNVHFAVLAWDGRADAKSWLELQQYALVGFGLAVAELAALAFARGWAQRVLGIQWLV